MGDLAQDRVTTSVDAVFTSYISASLTSRRKAKLAKRLLQPFSALGVRMAEIGKSFHENLLSTSTPFTEKTTYMHDEKDGMPNRGKIAQYSCRAALNT